MYTDSEPTPTWSAFPPTAKECARIRYLLERLPKHCLNAHDFENQIPLHLDSTAFYSLLSDLNRKRDKDWRLRAVAAWVLGVSSNFADNRPVISEPLRDIVKNRIQTKPQLYFERFWATVLGTIAFCYPAFALGLTFLIILGEAERGSIDFWICLFLGIVSAIPCTILATMIVLPIVLPFRVTDVIYSNNEARIMAILSLHRQNVLEALPELLGGACDKSLEVSEKCRLALTDFLPQITDANRDFMPLNSEELLGKILEDVPDLALGEAILDYLEKFEQGRSCAAVEFYLKCLMHKATVPAFNEVYAKGQRVFVVLQERRGRNRDGEHLLRHSIAPNAQPDELLRPAADSQTTPSEQLLRASTTGIIDT